MAAGKVEQRKKRRCTKEKELKEKEKWIGGRKNGATEEEELNEQEEELNKVKEENRIMNFLKENWDREELELREKRSSGVYEA